MTVAAVAARDPARAAAFAEAHDIRRVHETYQALVDDPAIDLVYIGLPPLFHAEWAIKAMAAGKPVLIEKPVAMNAAEALLIRQKAEETGLAALEAFHYRHHALMARLLALLPQLGTLVRLEARFDAMIKRSPEEFRWNAAVGGGALMDLGCYCVHWLRTVAGQEPRVVRARMEREGALDVTTEAHLAFPGGAAAALYTSMAAPRQASMRIEGLNGQIEVENPLAPQLGHRLICTINGQTTEETVEGLTTFAAQLAAVVAHLRHGAPFVLTADDAEKNMALLDAIRAQAV